MPPSHTPQPAPVQEAPRKTDSEGGGMFQPSVTIQKTDRQLFEEVRKMEADAGRDDEKIRSTSARLNDIISQHSQGIFHRLNPPDAGKTAKVSMFHRNIKSLKDTFDRRMWKESYVADRGQPSTSLSQMFQPDSGTPNRDLYEQVIGTYSGYEDNFCKARDVAAKNLYYVTSAILRREQTWLDGIMIHKDNFAWTEKDHWAVNIAKKTAYGFTSLGNIFQGKDTTLDTIKTVENINLDFDSSSASFFENGSQYLAEAEKLSGKIRPDEVRRIEKVHESVIEDTQDAIDYAEGTVTGLKVLETAGSVAAYTAGTLKGGHGAEASAIYSGLSTFGSELLTESIDNHYRPEDQKKSVGDQALSIGLKTADSAAGAYLFARFLGLGGKGTRMLAGSSVGTAAKGIVGKAGTAIKGIAGKAWTATKGAAGKAWTATKGAISKGWTATKGAISKGWTATKGAISKGWTATKGAISKGWTAIKGAAGKAWTATKGAAGKAWTATKGAAGKAWTATKGAISKGWTAAKEGISNGWNATKKGVSSTFNNIRNRFTGTNKAAEEATQEATQKATQKATEKAAQKAEGELAAKAMTQGAGDSTSSPIKAFFNFEENAIKKAFPWTINNPRKTKFFISGLSGLSSGLAAYLTTDDEKSTSEKIQNTVVGAGLGAVAPLGGLWTTTFSAFAGLGYNYYQNGSVTAGDLIGVPISYMPFSFTYGPWVSPLSNYVIDNIGDSSPESQYENNPVNQNYIESDEHALRRKWLEERFVSINATQTRLEEELNDTNSLKSQHEIELNETENHLSDLRSRMLEMEGDAEQLLDSTPVPGAWEALYVQYRSALDEFNEASAHLTYLSSNIQELAAYSMSISSEMETNQSQMEEIAQSAAETDETFSEK